MGGGPELVTRGRRPLDAPVNLVPYVDILMTLMVFLVMCAVFTQLSALTVQTSTSAAGFAEPTGTPTLSLRLTPTSVVVERAGQRVEVPRASAGLDGDALASALRAVGANADLCTLQSDDGVRSRDIVEVIDIARGLGITRVSIEPTPS